MRPCGVAKRDLVLMYSVTSSGCSSSDSSGTGSTQSKAQDLLQVILLSPRGQAQPLSMHSGRSI